MVIAMSELEHAVLPDLITDDLSTDEQLVRLQRRIDAATRPSAEVLLITSAVAKHYSETPERHLTNRNLRNDKIAKFATAMQDKNWCLNGQTVIFELGEAHGGRGRLLDGWHRMRASARSGCSFVTLVVFGVEASAFKFMDSGTARSVGDIFKMGDVPNPGLMAQTTRWIKILTGRNRFERGMRWEPHVAMTFFADLDTQRLTDLIPLARTIAKAAGRTMPKPQLLGYFYLLKPELAERLATRLLSPRHDSDGQVMFKWLANRASMGRTSENARTIALDAAVKAIQRRTPLTHRALTQALNAFIDRENDRRRKRRA
jgi:hypothetical protein